MIATVTLHLQKEGGEPSAYILTLGASGERWIVFNAGGLSMHLPDYGSTCVAAARQMAAALTQAADELETPPVVAPVDPKVVHG